MSAQTAEKSQYQTDVPMSSARRIHLVLCSMRDSYLDISLSDLVRCATNAEEIKCDSDSKPMSGVPTKMAVALGLRTSNNQIDIAHSQYVKCTKIPRIDPLIVAQALFPVKTQIVKVNNGHGVLTRPKLRIPMMPMRIIITTLRSLVNFFLDLPRQHTDSIKRAPIADHLPLSHRMDIKISIEGHQSDHQSPMSHHMAIRVAVSTITTTVLAHFLVMMALKKKKMATITGFTMSDP